jgi:alkaline phosphatase D
MSKYFRITAIGLVGLLFSNCVSKDKVDKGFASHPLAIVQGASDSDETYISVLSHAKDGPLEFVYTTVGDKTKKIKVSSFLKKLSPTKERIVEQVYIKNLDPLKNYMFTVLDKSGNVLDERGFKSLNLSKKNARVGVISCTDDHVPAATEMWTAYLNKFLDVNFMIGDNVYADRLDDGKAVTADPDQLWMRYIQTWDRLYFYHSANLSPTYYLWDDHDYGKNDGGSEFKHKEKSLDIFWTFHPGRNLEGSFKKTLGAGSILTAFDQDFMFIDGRYFREGKKGSRWGAAQTKLVLSNVKKSKAKIVWLIQGDQFFGAYHPFESFEKDHPEDFAKLLSELKNIGKKIIFVSGDRHLTEIMKIEKEQLGYSTYEITSSGMHAKVFPNSFEKHPNPRGELGASGVFNFTVLELNKKKLKDLKVKVTSYGAKNWTHYSKEIDL